MSAEIKKQMVQVNAQLCTVVLLKPVNPTLPAYGQNSLNLDILHQHDTKNKSPSKNLITKKEVKKLNFKKLKKEFIKINDGQSGMVASGFRKL